VDALSKKRCGPEQAHGPGDAVIMKKLRDGKIDLRPAMPFSPISSANL
jgi:hypothetical protein